MGKYLLAGPLFVVGIVILGLCCPPFAPIGDKLLLPLPGFPPHDPLSALFKLFLDVCVYTLLFGVIGMLIRRIRAKRAGVPTPRL
jgi:hypothetical protein